MHCLILLLAATTGNPIIESANAPPSLQRHAFDSTFHIVTPKAGGTAFAVDCRKRSDGQYDVTLVTAWHCVDDAEKDITAYSACGSTRPAYSGSYPARLVATDRDADVAVLRIVTPRPIPFLRIARDDRGSEASLENLPGITIGCTRSDFPTIWNVGIRGKEWHEDLAGLSWVIDRFSIPGRSGGPLICTDFEHPDFGRVLGVCCRNGDAESYFCDTHRLRRCIEKAGVPQETMTVPGDRLFPTGFVPAALRVVLVTILCSFIRLGGSP